MVTVKTKKSLQQKGIGKKSTCGDRVDRILTLMQIQARMPDNLFETRDEAYKRVGCDPRASMFIFTR